MLAVFNTRPILSRIAVLIILPLVILITIVVLRFDQALPEDHSVLHLNAIPGEIQIQRDEHGQVLINGQDLNALYAGLGYAHAQDRLWQMELARRQSAGRLSEIFGESKLLSDKFFRSLDFYHYAAADYAALDARSRAVLDAYAQGVNAWLEAESVLPVEFSLLSITPEPWSALDSLALFKNHAFRQSRNWVDELQRMILSQSLGGDVVAQIVDAEAATAEANTADLAAGVGTIPAGALSQLEQLEQELKLQEPSAGGIAWAVAGEGTTASLVANHYSGPELPNTYYLVRFNSPELQLQGATIAGVPLILQGNNQHIAWAAVGLNADTSDIALERFDLYASNQAEYAGQFEALQVKEQAISVKQRFPAVLREPYPAYRWQSRRSRNGPVISDVLDRFALPLSLRWTGFRDHDHSFSAWLELSLAADWDSFRAAAARLTVPATALIYADEQGQIGRYLAGRLPQRNTSRQDLPQAGWLPETQWTDLAPIADAAEWNPNTPWLSSVVAENEALSSTADRYRLQRLSHLLEQAQNTTALDQRQNDVYEPMAAELLPLLLAQLSASPAESETETLQLKEARAYLREWDFEADKDSVAATIFYAWSQQIVAQAIVDGAAGQRLSTRDAASLVRWLQRDPAPLLRYLLSAQTDSSSQAQTLTQTFCHNHGGAGAPCAGLFGNALNQALAQLRLERGSDLADWHWGDSHTIPFRHSAFADVSVLGRLFNRERPAPGSVYSLQAGMALHSERGGFAVRSLTGLQQRVQLGNATQGANIQADYQLASGQSGSVFSPHYEPQDDAASGVAPSAQRE